MILAVQLTFAQSIFNNRFDINKDAEAFANVIFYNNNFILTGRSFDSTFYYTPAFSKAKISLIKTDINGNKLFNKKYGENFNDYGSILDDCLSVSNYFYGVGSYTDSVYKVHQYLFKFNEQGDSLLLVHYFENDTTIETYAGNCKITRDSNLILSGVVDSSYYNQFSQMYLMKTDTLGNIIWWKTYGGTQYETCTNMDTTSDGGFILGGWTTSFGGTDQDPYIVKTDSSGNFQWHKTINSNSFNDWPAVVLSTQDGGILAVTTEVQKQDVNYKYTKTFFNKYDISGNLLWRKNVGDTLLQPPVFAVKEAPNGDIVAVGTSAYYNHIFKINANGDSLLFKQIYRTEDCTTMQQYAFDIALIDSGGYAIAGFVIPDAPNINNTQDAWLSTYDSLGCQLPDSIYNLNTQINITGQDTIIELTWDYDLSLTNPNLVYMVLRYNKDVYAWDSPWEYCQSVLTTDDFCYLTTKSFTDTVHCFTERKYRVYAVDTLNQLTSCYSNEINVDILTNISELEKNKDSEILVYPNPSHGIFNIALPTVKDEIQVSIYNLSGQQIKNITLKDKGIIDISKQPNGIYFVKVIHQHKVITQKIIKY